LQPDETAAKETPMILWSNTRQRDSCAGTYDW